MRVAFAGGNGYPPEDFGGVQSSTHDMALRLQARGGVPAVLAPLYGDGAFGLAARARLKLGRAKTVEDDRAGYPVHRAWHPDQAVGAFCDAFRPDVAVVQCHGTVPIAKGFVAADVPVVIYLRNVEFSELGGNPGALEVQHFIANSRFTAEAYRAAFGLGATVIPPTVEPARFQTETSGEFVTFIGPVAEKGLAKALEIARRCPDIPFLFCESWALDPAALDALSAAIRPMPNIKFERRCADIRGVFSRTRILLAPSMWDEAWGRVASEAHCSGIPVLGSNRGGLPEAIGPGGATLDYDAPTDDWVRSLRRIWDDPDEHRRLSAAALSYSRRPEMNGDRQFETLLAILADAARGRIAA
ncbi:MAG: glycosyltransferase [Silicimonas sp.]|nr:glycosyltransferase [Silicimonas sp.]